MAIKLKIRPDLEVSRFTLKINWLPVDSKLKGWLVHTGDVKETMGQQLVNLSLGSSSATHWVHSLEDLSLILSGLFVCLWKAISGTTVNVVILSISKSY